MKDVVKYMLQCPIASIFIIGAVTNGIANIISAAKGTGTQPVVNIVSGSEPNNN